ncbi:MAG: LysR family transcriptional regulator [Sneathiella sp.]
MLDFGAIPVFVTVLEQGSFSGAANKLGITKSAVSKRITALEAHLGVTLLHRSTRRLSLTEAGTRYLDHAQSALHSAQQAEFAVADLQETPKGTLRVSTPMSFSRLHLAPIIPEFLKQYPSITVHLDMSDIASNIVADGYDIGLRTASNLPDSSLIARKIAPLKSVLCASPDYVKENIPIEGPQDLLVHNCILYSYHTGGNEWTFIKEGEEERIQISGNYHVNNSEALLTALELGAGVGRVPTFIAGEALKTGRLVPILDQYAMPQALLYAVFPERQYLPEKVRVFLDFVVSKIASDKPYWDEWK